MMKLLIVFLMAVGMAVSPNPTESNSTMNSTSQMISNTATMSTMNATTTSGTEGVRLHSFNLLFLPLTITASAFYLSR